MKSESAKNKLIEEGLNIKGLQYRFQNSTPNGMPSRRTTVPIIGLPLEAKNYQVGKTLEEMGFGRHRYTRPVMKKTPTKGTPYYSGIFVAVMEDLLKPTTHYISVKGYRVRAIHTGQGDGRSNMSAEDIQPTPDLSAEKDNKTTARELAEEVIEQELVKIIEETKEETTTKGAVKEIEEIRMIEEKESDKGDERKKDERTQEISEIEMAEEKEKVKNQRKKTRRKKSQRETIRALKEQYKEERFKENPPGSG